MDILSGRAKNTKRNLSTKDLVQTWNERDKKPKKTNRPKRTMSLKSNGSKEHEEIPVVPIPSQQTVVTDMKSVEHLGQRATASFL